MKRKNIKSKLPVAAGAIPVPQPAGIIKVPAIDRDEAKIPEKYSDNTVVLMARDPYWCYAFWDISNSLLEEKKKSMPPEWGAAKLQLRVHDVTGASEEAFNKGRYLDVSIGDIVGNVYVNIWSPAREYQAQAGLITMDGHFIPLAISNRIQTPADSVSEEKSEEWMENDAAYSEISGMSGGENNGLSGTMMGSAAYNEKHKPKGYRGNIGEANNE